MKKTKILVVDDDVAASRMLKTALERTGWYEVKVENVSTRALDTARIFRPDFAILDVCMPDVQGGDVAAQFRADAHLSTTPVAFLTSVVSRDEAGDRPMQRGGYTFFAKPVTLRAIIEHIEKILPRDSEAGSNTESSAGSSASTAAGRN